MPGDYHSFREWVITNLDPSDYPSLDDYLYYVRAATNQKVVAHEEGWLTGQYVLHKVNKEEAEKAEVEELKAAAKAKRLKEALKEAKPKLEKETRAEHLTAARTSRRARQRSARAAREREISSRFSYEAQQRIGEQINAVPIPAEFFA